MRNPFSFLSGKSAHRGKTAAPTSGAAFHALRAFVFGAVSVRCEKGGQLVGVDVPA